MIDIYYIEDDDAISRAVSNYMLTAENEQYSSAPMAAIAAERAAIVATMSSCWSPAMPTSMTPTLTPTTGTPPGAHLWPGRARTRRQDLERRRWLS